MKLNPTRYHLNAILALALILVGGTSFQIAKGQSESGSASIEGVVKDANGELVGGAAITIRNEETGLQRAGTTGSTFIYSVPVLPVGRYTIRLKPKALGQLNSDVILRVGENLLWTSRATCVINERLQVLRIRKSSTKMSRPRARPSARRSGFASQSRSFSEYVLLTLR